MVHKSLWNCVFTEFYCEFFSLENAVQYMQEVLDAWLEHQNPCWVSDDNTSDSEETQMYVFINMLVINDYRFKTLVINF